MGAKEDAELVRRGYDAFVAGDMEWMNEHLHENIVWHVPGGSVLAGDHQGRENVLAFFAKSVSLALPEIDVHDVVASQDHVVAILTTTWRRSDGTTLVDKGVQVFHLDNGQAIEAWNLNEDVSKFDQFIGGAS